MLAGGLVAVRTRTGCDRTAPQSRRGADRDAARGGPRHGATRVRCAELVSERIVKNHAERAACTTLYFRDAVPHDGLGPTAGTSDRPFAHRDDCGIALSERNDDGTRLHAGAVFHQYQFTTLEVASRRIKKNDDLKWKVHLPVKVLMQPVVV